MAQSDTTPENLSSAQKRKPERLIYGFIDVFVTPGKNDVEVMYEIDQANLSIGRDHHCSIRINNLRVSRHQCSIIQEAKGFGRFETVLQNLTSHPTTTVGNMEICDQGKVQLLDGCRFKIFDTELRWRQFNPDNPSGQVDPSSPATVKRLSENGQIAQNCQNKTLPTKRSRSLRSSSTPTSPNRKSAPPKLVKRRSSDLDLRKTLLQKSLRKSVKETLNFDDGNSCLLESQHSILEESSGSETGNGNPDFTSKNISEDIKSYTPEVSLTSTERVDFDSSLELTPSAGKLHDEGKKRPSLNQPLEEVNMSPSSHKKQLNNNIPLLSRSQNGKDCRSDDLSDVSTQSVDVNEDVEAETQLMPAGKDAQDTEDPSVEDLESEIEEFIPRVGPLQTESLNKSSMSQKEFNSTFDNPVLETKSEMFTQVVGTANHREAEALEVAEDINGELDAYESENMQEQYVHAEPRKSSLILESDMFTQQVDEMAYGREPEAEATEENEDFTSVDIQNMSVLERSDVNVRVVKEYSEDGNGETNVFESEGLENHSTLERSSVTGAQELFTSEDVDASEKVNSFYAPEMSTISDRIYDLNSSHVSTQNMLPDEEIEISSLSRLAEESSMSFSSHKNNIEVLSHSETKMVENDESGSFITSEDEEFIDLNSHEPPVTTVLPNDNEDIKISSQNKLLEESNISFSAAKNDNIELLIHSETKMVENDESFLTSEDEEEVIIDLNSHGPPETRILSSEEINISARPKESNTPLSSVKNDNIESQPKIAFKENDESGTFLNSEETEDEKTTFVNFNCSTQSTTDERIEGLALSKLSPEDRTSFSPYKNDIIELPTESEAETEENHGSESLLTCEEIIDCNSQEGSTQIVIDERVDGSSLNQLAEANSSFSFNKNDNIEFSTESETEENHGSESFLASEEIIDFNCQEGSTQIISDERVDGPSLNQLPPEANTSFFSYKNDRIELLTQSETEVEGSCDCGSLLAAYSKEIDLNSYGSSQSVNFSDERVDASSVNHLLPEAKTSVSFHKNGSVELLSQSENDREEDDDELGEELNTSTQSHKDSNVEFLPEPKADTEEVHEISSTSKGINDLNSSQESIQSIELPDQGTTRPSLNLMKEEPNISSSHKDDSTEFFSQGDTDKEAKKDDLKTVSDSGGIIELNSYDSIRKSKRSSINQLGEESNTSSQSHNNIGFLADPKTDTEASEDHEICSTAKDKEDKNDDPETASTAMAIMNIVDQPHQLTPKRCDVTPERLLVKGLPASENEDELEATNTRRLKKSAKKTPVSVPVTRKHRLQEKVVLMKTAEDVEESEESNHRTSKILKLEGKETIQLKTPLKAKEVTPGPEEKPQRGQKTREVTSEAKEKRGRPKKVATQEPEDKPRCKQNAPLTLEPEETQGNRLKTRVPEPKEEPKTGLKTGSVTAESEEKVLRRGRKRKMVTQEPEEKPRRRLRTRAVFQETDKNSEKRLSTREMEPEHEESKKRLRSESVTRGSLDKPRQGRKPKMVKLEPAEEPRRGRKPEMMTVKPEDKPRRGRPRKVVTPEQEDKTLRGRTPKVVTQEAENKPGRGRPRKVVTPKTEENHGRGRPHKVVTPKTEENPGRGRPRKVVTPKTEEKRGRRRKVITPKTEEKPGRGRPRKVVTPKTEEKRGRPRKVVTPKTEEKPGRGRPRTVVTSNPKPEGTSRRRRPRNVVTLEIEETPRRGRPRKVVTPEPKEKPNKQLKTRGVTPQREVKVTRSKTLNLKL